MITVAGVSYARMADSIIPADLPAGMDAYLGYVDGRWPDYLDIAKAHGNVPVYSLDVNGVVPATGEDTEPGNIDPDAAAAQLAKEKAAGVDRPIGYCPESWAETLVAKAAAHDLSGSYTRQGRAGSWRLLTAHYALQNGQPWQHICGPATCGCPVEADGTQWVDHGNWDESLLTVEFIGAASHPGPSPAVPLPPKAKEAEMYAKLQDPTTGGWWIAFPSGAVDAARNVAPYLGGANNQKQNPSNLPCVQILPFSDPSGAGYTLVIDTGNDGRPGGRLAYFDYPRSGTAKV